MDYTYINQRGKVLNELIVGEWELITAVIGWEPPNKKMWWQNKDGSISIVRPTTEQDRQTRAAMNRQLVNDLIDRHRTKPRTGYCSIGKVVYLPTQD